MVCLSGQFVICFLLSGQSPGFDRLAVRGKMQDICGVCHGPHCRQSPGLDGLVARGKILFF